MTNFLDLQRHKLDIQEATNLVTEASCGAISIFIGTTRDNCDGKNVISLEYEAYESMAKKEMERICDNVREQWPEVENILIYHRLGEVPVKESSVIIAVSSPHREHALKATEFCINNLKQSVPIWKKEIYATEEPTWKENKELMSESELTEKKFKIESVKSVSSQCKDAQQKIKQFGERKRAESNKHNSTEFFPRDYAEEGSCARIGAVVPMKKDSKSLLNHERVINTHIHRDQKSSEYLLEHVRQDGFEERLQQLENILNLKKNKGENIYDTLKRLEYRVFVLNSISPEYFHIWKKVKVPNKSQKRIYKLSDLDEMMTEIHKRKKLND